MRISALQKKLLRDLWRIRGQAIAVSAVIGAGVAMFVLLLSTFDSLYLSRETYYGRYRFGDVFATLRRAPLRVADRIREIPGVAQIETRVVADVNLDIPGVPEPGLARLISVPEDRRPGLCDLFLREGRWIEPGRPDEVIVSEGFALRNDLRPGATVTAILNGRRQALRVVGVALSPEYIYTIRPGELIADDRLFGVFWMGRRSLATAFDMDGAFNDVVLSLTRDASSPEVIARLDRILEPWGGFGAVPRSLQLSHFFLASELEGLGTIGRIIPVVFLAVAAFLLNVVMTRIVSVQREEIAALKAMGYSNAALGRHFVQWGLAVAVAGSILGIAAGARLGLGMTRMYAAFYRFPILEYRLAPDLAGKAVIAALVAGTLGAVFAVRRVVNLPPAEAMRPEPPARYRPSPVERIGLGRILTQPTRIVLRNLQRHPGRAFLSILGISCGGAMVVLGTFTLDSITWITDVQFNFAQRYDAMVTFTEPVSSGALQDLRRLPGVMAAEPFRAAAVRLRHGPLSRTTAITGLPEDSRLLRVLDMDARAVAVPPEGLLLSEALAEVLGAVPGDLVTVEVLEGTRPVRTLPLAATVDDALGSNAYMDLRALRRMLQEGDSLSGAHLLLDEAFETDLYRRLKAIPAVAGVSLKGLAYRSFEETIAETFTMTTNVTALFAAIIAFGVVYNTARIALSERSRELATLRVLGFRRAEIAWILLGELAILTLLAIPLGLVLGYVLAAWMIGLWDTEVFRMPLVISPATYARSAVTVIAAALFSGWIVRRKLHRLDLIAVLKTRE